MPQRSRDSSHASNSGRARHTARALFIAGAARSGAPSSQVGRGTGALPDIASAQNARGRQRALGGHGGQRVAAWRRCEEHEQRPPPRVNSSPLRAAGIGARSSSDAQTAGEPVTCLDQVARGGLGSTDPRAPARVGLRLPVHVYLMSRPESSDVARSIVSLRRRHASFVACRARSHVRREFPFALSQPRPSSGSTASKSRPWWRLYDSTP